MNKGKIIQVMGPVVDVAFEGDLPKIKDALHVESEGKTLVMEVAQQIGSGVVRCIMLAASEGLHKDMEVVATGGAISVPVGEKCLGRLFNVTGETIDGLEDLSGEEHWGIHRRPPDLKSKAQMLKFLKRALRLSICSRLMQRAVKSASSAVPV